MLYVKYISIKNQQRAGFWSGQDHKVSKAFELLQISLLKKKKKAKQLEKIKSILTSIFTKASCKVAPTMQSKSGCGQSPMTHASLGGVQRQ